MTSSCASHAVAAVDGPVANDEVRQGRADDAGVPVLVAVDDLPGGAQDRRDRDDARRLAQDRARVVLGEARARSPARRARPDAWRDCGKTMMKFEPIAWICGDDAPRARPCRAPVTITTAATPMRMPEHRERCAQRVARDGAQGAGGCRRRGRASPHSTRRAAIGSSFAARHAGRKPKTVPMMALVVTATSDGLAGWAPSAGRARGRCRSRPRCRRRCRARRR